MSYTHKVVPIDQIRPHPRNARTHSKKQIRQIAASIRALGFAAPFLIDENKMLIAGHGRLEAAKSLGMSSIPAIVISGLSDAKKRALLLADNRIAQSAGWDREQLAIELAALPELLVEDDLDISITGFEPAEIDALHADFEDASTDPADEIDDSCLDGPAVTQCWRSLAAGQTPAAVWRCAKFGRSESSARRRTSPHGVPRSALQRGGRQRRRTRGREASRVCHGVWRDVA